MKQFLLFCIGAICGAGGRALIMQCWNIESSLATLTINCIGCVLIGVVWGLAPSLSQTQILILMTAFLGSFTTFSTFGLDVFKYFQEGSIIAGFSYLLASMGVGVGAVWFGYIATSWFKG